MRTSQTGVPAMSAPQRVLLALCAVPVALMVVFLVRRGQIDIDNLSSGTVPDSPTDVAYVQHPWLAYSHILPALAYLVGAPLQLAERVRTRHYSLHRRLGRVLVVAGLVSGVAAIVFGIAYPVGRAAEASASVVFGLWFLCCLALALRAIRRGDPATHRRWMIRAFVVAIGVGTIRLWLLLLWGSGLLDIRTAFGVSFWVAFAIHVGIGEWWVRSAPPPVDAVAPNRDAIARPVDAVLPPVDEVRSP